MKSERMAGRTRPVNEAALARLRAIQAGDEPTPPAWAQANVRLVAFEAGHVHLEVRADARHLNAFGGVHGGFVAAALDTALGLAIFTSLGDDGRHTTVDLAVKIVKRLPVDTDLAVESSLVHVSRSVGVSQAWLRDAGGTVYAHGTTTCHIKRHA